jgi:acyl-CoA synthetase (AMP-forming)/AMP-acid ligase II
VNVVRDEVRVVIGRPSWGNVGPQWSGAGSATVVDLVRRACEHHGTAPALVFEDGLVVSYRDLLDRAERFAGALRGRVARGDRVAVMLPNRAEFMIAWLAGIAARATVVAMNPGSKSHDAIHVLRDSESKLIVTDAEHRELLESVRAQCPDLREILWVRAPEPDGLLSYSAGLPPLKFSESGAERDDITNIFYTSGTTGPPKGCMVDHEWWLRTVDVLLRRVPSGPDDRQLCCLQFFYGDPCHQLLECLHTGGALVVMRRFSVSRFWDVVRGNGVTQILSFSSIPLFLLKAPPTPRDREHKVRLARHLAMPPHLHREIVRRWGFPWVEGYGITEGNIVAGMPLQYAEEMIGSGSIGIPAPEVSVCIVDDDGQDVPPGHVGEFLVKGPGMFRGYLNRPEATAEVMRDGWLRTGDLGRADEQGFLYLIGRKKDIVRRSGQNISATEVEDVLRSHPKILDAAVVAVPDELRGEEVKAYVLPAGGESRETVPPEDLIAFCAERLSAFKIPRYIEYRSNDFARTPSMRIRKEILRQERPDLTAGAWDRERPSPSGRAAR